MTELELLYLLLEIQWGINETCPKCMRSQHVGHLSSCKLAEAINFLSACLDDPELTADSWKYRKNNDFNGGGVA